MLKFARPMGMVSLGAALLLAGCVENDVTVSVEGDSASLQGAPLYSGTDRSEEPERLMGGKVPEPAPESTSPPAEESTSSPTEELTQPEAADVEADAATDTTTDSSADANWPTVDSSSTGTPAAGAPAAGPGGHTANHTDPSKGANRSKYVPDDSRLVTFDELASFWYDAPEPEEVVENPEFKPENQFPDFIQEMDSTKVTLEGYVVPISIEKGRVKAFILSRYVANCCFGMMPELNEWVEVEMPDGEGLDFLPYGTVMTTGTMRVGEVFDEYGYIRSLYRIDAETVVEPDY